MIRLETKRLIIRDPLPTDMDDYKKSVCDKR